MKSQLKSQFFFSLPHLFVVFFFHLLTLLIFMAEKLPNRSEYCDTRETNGETLLAFTWFFKHKIICVLHKLFITAIIVGFCSPLFFFFGFHTNFSMAYRTKNAFYLFFFRSCLLTMAWWVAATTIHPIFNYVCNVHCCWNCYMSMWCLRQAAEHRQRYAFGVKMETIISSASVLCVCVWLCVHFGCMSLCVCVQCRSF